MLGVSTPHVPIAGIVVPRFQAEQLPIAGAREKGPLGKARLKRHGFLGGVAKTGCSIVLPDGHEVTVSTAKVEVVLAHGGGQERLVVHFHVFPGELGLPGFLYSLLMQFTMPEPDW